MALWKHAHQKNDLSKILRKISLSLGLIAFIVCLGLYFEYYGFDQGFLVAEKSYENLLVDRIELSGDGPRTYEFFGDMYRYIASFLLIFLISKFLEAKNLSEIVFGRKLLFQIMCLFSLSLALYQFWQLFYWKKDRSQSSFWTEPYDKILRDTVLFDWFCLVIILVLLIIQIIIPIFYYFDKNRQFEEQLKIYSM